MRTVGVPPGRPSVLLRVARLAAGKVGDGAATRGRDRRLQDPKVIQAYSSCNNSPEAVSYEGHGPRCSYADTTHLAGTERYPWARGSSRRSFILVCVSCHCELPRPGHRPGGATVSHVPAAIITERRCHAMAKRHCRPSLHYRYEHYDPR